MQGAGSAGQGSGKVIGDIKTSTTQSNRAKQNCHCS